MKKIVDFKEFKVLKYLFIAISFISIIYATITMRGIYNDGTYYMINILNNLANNNYTPVIDPDHPRIAMLILMQLPLWICHFLHLDNKFFLMQLFTFTQLFLPLLILFWNYKLSQRTNRPDIFFWHLFVYSLILLPCSIFSVIESIIGAGLNFVLWNYLVNDIEYKKGDILTIILLCVCMFGIYEYTALLGIIFFVASIKFLKETIDLKNKIIKSFIGITSISAAIYTFIYMVRITNTNHEIGRFFKEGIDYIPHILEFCILFSVITIVFLVICYFQKKLLTRFALILIFFIYIGIFLNLCTAFWRSLVPLYECYIRTIVCWALPLIFTSLIFFNKRNFNTIKYTNIICIALICGIFQTSWQIVNTYFWQRNITHIKNEITNSGEILFMPDVYDTLSAFFDGKLHRYIWYNTYPAISILLSTEYEQKTLLTFYKTEEEPIIDLKKKHLYKQGEHLSIPALHPENYIDIKNKYWDLTTCANEIDKHIKNFEPEK